MKILVATNAGGLEDSVSPVFGRCQSYTIVEVDEDEIKNIEIVQNQFANAVHGAGIQAGQFVVGKGVKAVIAGNFGPNVASILQQAGIEMILSQGKVKDVIEKYVRGELKTGISSMPQRGIVRMRKVPPPPMHGHQMPLPPHMSRKEEIAMLEEQLNKMEDMLKDIKKRIEELKK